MAGNNQQRNHANAHQDDRAHHGWHAWSVGSHIASLPGVSLRLPCIALRAPCGTLLLAIHPPLRLRIVRRWLRPEACSEVRCS